MRKTVSSAEFQRRALQEFRGKVISWSGDGNVGPISIDNISDIERIINDLVPIGRYVIVDYAESHNFDNFSACYRKGDCLYIAWYENADRLHTGERHSHYLKFRPARMLINAIEEPRLNHIVIDTDPIKPRKKSENINNPDAYGIQCIIYPHGSELKPFAPGEICHVFDVICNPGRILLHPKGSIFTQEKRGYYFVDHNKK